MIDSETIKRLQADCTTLDKDVQLYKIELEQCKRELHELKNIENQHRKMNGLLHEEVNKLRKENEFLKKENKIIRGFKEREKLKLNFN